MSFSILDLPTEVIAHIFSFVSNKKDRRNLALLCKRGYKIVRHQAKHNHLNLLDKRKNFSSLLIFEQIDHDEFPFEKLSLRSENIKDYKGLWLRHGDKIIQMTLECGLSELKRFGSEFKELFPNLCSVDFQIQNFEFDLEKVKLKHYFSEKINNLYLECNNRCFKLLDSILELFPGLKCLKLKFFLVYTLQASEVQELKELLVKWLPKLEKIDLSFPLLDNRLHLLEAFNGLTSDKLDFEFTKFALGRENANILKSFFNGTRQIKSLKINCEDFFMDSNLCALIDENATIDRLSIPGDELANLQGLINARGVQEVVVYKSSLPFTNIRFTPESLLKVKELTVYGHSEDDIIMIPRFHNLRYLDLRDIHIGDEELDFIINNFTFLEDLRISKVHATNGHAIGNLKHLRRLEISGSPFLSNGFFDFGVIMPNLKTLSITSTPLLLIVGVESIVKNCPNIQMIELGWKYSFTVDMVDLLAHGLFYIEKIHLLPDYDAYSFLSSLQEKYPSLISNSHLDE